jgi:nicotinamide-nucleotide amidase
MKLIKNYELAVQAIRKDIKRYIKENNLENLILGISGGIDSALVAVLAKPVCDELGIKLIGRYIGIEGNSKDEQTRADHIGLFFCNEYDSYNLTSEYEKLSFLLDIERPNIDTERAYKIRAGNIKARMRMITLYNAAQAYNGLVLSTDNWTEYQLGFWTLHGDVGDFGPIQSLWKTEVYEMSEWLVNNELHVMFADGFSNKQLALIDCIECNATDGLGITKTDLDQIFPDWRKTHLNTRSGYKEVDKIIDIFLTSGKFPKNNKKNISDRVKASAFKRNNPYNTSRSKIV